MNQNRMILGLAVAVVVAFLLSTIVYRQFQKASSVKPVVTGQIVVAAKPLSLGTRVDASNLRPNFLGRRASPLWAMFTAYRGLHRSSAHGRRRR